MLVGVLGGGQLGRMLALAGIPLGLRFRFFDPDASACAQACGALHVAPWGDERAVRGFAAGCDVVTYEFENVPVETVRVVERAGVRVLAGVDALGVAQDRVSEKEFFARAGLDVHPWARVDAKGDLAGAVARIGLPCVLKSRRGGYDGKGQAVLRTQGDVSAAWAMVGGCASILEKFVAFEREVSVIAVRGADGAFEAYPLVENEHRGGILRVSRAPARGAGGVVAREATAHVRTLMEQMGYVGVLAVEFFESSGKLLANEMAPRVHNSGHWTIEGAQTSQFENHLRAVCGLPLGPCAAQGESVMVNLVGESPALEKLLAVRGAHVHWYGKSVREGRKVGHVTVCGDEEAVARVVREVWELGIGIRDSAFGIRNS